MDGLQINLDNGEGRFVRGKLLDDISFCCTLFIGMFLSEEKLSFTTGSSNYFTYKMVDWVPLIYKEVYEPSGLWSYDVQAYPKMFFDIITKPVTDTKKLAMALGVKLTDNSESLPIKYPIINQNACTLIQEIRRQSFNDAYIKENMEDAYFIYFNSEYMQSMRWGNLSKQDAQQLENLGSMDGQNIVTYIDDRIYSVYDSAIKAEVWQQKDYIKKILGRTVHIKTSAPAVFANVYSIKFTDTDAMDQSSSFLCTRVQFDINEPIGYELTFKEVNFYG